MHGSSTGMPLVSATRARGALAWMHKQGGSPLDLPQREARVMDGSAAGVLLPSVTMCGAAACHQRRCRASSVTAPCASSVTGPRVITDGAVTVSRVISDGAICHQ